MKRNTFGMWRRAVAAAALAGASVAAQAGTFTCISGSFSDCAQATSTLSWSWSGLDFTIGNEGTGYVSEVYFDLSSGMSASFVGGTGTVNFVAGAQPPSLPGGTSVGFTSDAAFDSDASGQPVWGLNTGETATFRILGASADSFDVGTLDAGLHVRSLVTGSASVITTPVPEPETYAMMALGMGLVAWSARARSKR